MTETNQDHRHEYEGSGGTGPWSFTFPVKNANEVRVAYWKADDDIDDSGGAAPSLVINVDFTVTLTDGGASGGTVNALTFTPQAGEYVHLFLDTPVEQNTDYPFADFFPSQATEDGLDKLTRLQKVALRDRLERVLKVPDAGSWSQSDPFDALTRRIKNLVDPVNPQDAATRAFVQSEIINAELGGAGYTISPYMAGMLPEVSASAVMAYLTFSAFHIGLVTAADLNAYLTAMGISADLRAFLATADDAAARLELGISSYWSTAVNTWTDEYLSRGGLRVNKDTQLNNLLVNPNYAVWQNGESYPAVSDGDHVCDGWYALVETAGAVDVQRGSEVPDWEYETQDRWTQPVTGSVRVKPQLTSSNGQYALVQIIESEKCIPLRGRNVSAALSAKAPSGSTINLGRVFILSWDGTADAPTRDVVSAWNGAAQDPTWAANWTVVGSFAATYGNDDWVDNWGDSILGGGPFAVPAGCNNLAFVLTNDEIGWGNAAGDYFEIAAARLTPGSYVGRPRQDGFMADLLECQRFFNKTYPYATIPGGGPINGTLKTQNMVASYLGCDWRFPVPMIAAPGITRYAWTGGGTSWVDTGGTLGTNSAVAGIDECGAYFYRSGGTAPTIGAIYCLHATADARF